MILCCTFLLVSCNSTEDRYSATGVFEAEEVIVSAEASGKLLRFDLKEGQELNRDGSLGQIDTVQLSLQIPETLGEIFHMRNDGHSSESRSMRR